MRRLSMRAAQRCETAKTPHCRCRCGGLLHGKDRGGDESFFEGLPKEDPHHALAKRQPKLPRAPKPERPLPLLDGLG